MKKRYDVGIYTIYNLGDRNCGQTLQAYALQKYIKKETSLNPVILNYRRKKKYVPENFIIYWLLKFLKDFFHGHLVRQIRFNIFCRNYLETSPIIWDKKKAESFLEKSKISKLIVGSDQVWNPLDGCNFLTFFEIGDENIQRYSYSPSMDCISVMMKFDKFYIEKSEAINRFDMLGVREESAKKFLQNYTDKDIKVNVDPVFLLDADEWKRNFDINDKVVKREYMLLYSVGIIEKDMIDLMTDISCQTDTDIVVIQNNESAVFPKGWIVKRHITPDEFLKLMYGAKYIFGDSFHMVCFSIIFKKSFYVYPAKLSYGKPNVERITDLLSLCSLSDRLIERQGALELSVSEIDYDGKTETLAERIRESKQFIKMAMSVS